MSQFRDASIEAICMYAYRKHIIVFQNSASDIIFKAHFQHLCISYTFKNIKKFDLWFELGIGQV